MNFYVAEWYVDADANRIHNGELDIKLEGKVMSLLTYLAENQGQVVSRQQLEADVWSDRVISYDALTSCITRLRKVLGDDSRNPVFIETVPKKGYRLIAEVRWDSAEQSGIDQAAIEQTGIEQTGTGQSGTEQDGQSAHAPGASGKNSRRSLFRNLLVLALLLTLVIAGTLLLTLSPEDSEHTAELSETPSILILPFDNLSKQTGQAYFSDGITADISIALAKLSGLRVIAAPSMLAVQDGDNRDVADDVQKLARYVLTGSVQRDGNKLRVNVMLVDNSSRQHLWAESYDRQVTAVFDVQDDITSNIVSALSIKLTEEEKKRVAHRYTRSIEAYDQFLRGQALYIQHTSSDNLLAREYLLRAIQIDPNFARAYGTLALSYVDEYRYQWSSDTDRPLMKTLSLAEKAVSIDDRLPQSYWALAYAQLHLKRYHDAENTVKQALSVNPDYADGYAILALIHIYQGDAATGISMIRRAMKLNPDYPAQYISVLGQAYYYLGEYDSAELVLRDAVDKNFSMLTAHIMLTATLSKAGKHDEASWSATQLRTLSPGFSLQDVGRIFPVKDAERLQDIIEQLRRADNQADR